MMRPSVNTVLSMTSHHFNVNIVYLFNKCVPLHHKIVKPTHKPWLTQNIKDAIINRDKAYAKWIRYQTSNHYCNYKALRRHVGYLIKTSKRDHYYTVFNSAVNSNRMWNQLRNLGIGKQTNNLTFIDTDINDLNLNFTQTQVPEAAENP